MRERTVSESGRIVGGPVPQNLICSVFSPLTGSEKQAKSPGIPTDRGVAQPGSASALGAGFPDPKNPRNPSFFTTRAIHCGNIVGERDSFAGFIPSILKVSPRSGTHDGNERTNPFGLPSPAGAGVKAPANLKGELPCALYSGWLRAESGLYHDTRQSLIALHRLVGFDCRMLVAENWLRTLPGERTGIRDEGLPNKQPSPCSAPHSGVVS